MKLIFALGNPGLEYAQTRHNVGFMVLSAFASQQSGVQFVEKAKFKAYLAELSIDGEKVLLAKPTTFYNLAGESMRAICDFHKIAAKDVLVVHDELALPFGTIRVREGGSDAGNNGIKSINQHGGSETTRLRIGISSEQRVVMGDTDFVLSRFNFKETQLLTKEILPRAFDIVRDFIAENHQITSQTIA